MSLHVAIPSYRRPEMCRDKTIRLLTSRGIDPSAITVFVADLDEAQTYLTALAGTGVVVEVSAPGQIPSRHVIADRYKAGEWVLHCDDDLDDLVERVDDRTLVPVDDVGALAREAFRTCEQVGVRLWGVYPVANPYFMRASSSTDLALVAGPFHGTIATPNDPALRITLCTNGDKFDYERTLRYFCADGGVLRLNRVALKTRWYKNPGGQNGIRTRATEEAACAALVAGFPGLVRINERRRSQFPELRFVTPRKVSHET